MTFICLGFKQPEVFNDTHGSQTRQFSQSEDDDHAENSAEIQG